MSTDMNIRLVQEVIGVMGLMAFALSGFMEARRHMMDIGGIFAVGFVTAFGGGTVRDLLLDQRPWFWVSHDEYVWLVLAMAAIALTPTVRLLSSRASEQCIIVADALGTGLFSVLGTYSALSASVPLFPASIIGVVTGISGGVLRDVLCNRIPTVLEQDRFYAVCPFCGCWIFILCYKLALPHGAAVIAGLLVTVAFRVLALRFDLRLPGLR